MMQKRPLIPTCALCANFDGVAGLCTVTQEAKVSYDYTSPVECQETGRYIRYLHIIPGIFNYYPEGPLPATFTPDYSRVAKDSKGRPLVIQTRRGLEIAIPVSNDIELEVNPLFNTVDHIYSLQGQRELIRLLGYEYTKQVAESASVPFIGSVEDMYYEGTQRERDKFEKSEELTRTLKLRNE